MGIADYFLLVLIIIWTAAAFRYMYRQRKKGGCIGCRGCCSSCSKRKS